MNKIKKIWRENKVLLVLAIILIICFVIFMGVALTYFYGSSNNPYGNRLDITEKVPLSDKLLTDIKTELESDENVDSASVRLQGKIVYISIIFRDEYPMGDAKNVASKALPLFNDDELQVYDIAFTISTKQTENSAGYSLMGARNANGVGAIVWNNYNIEENNG